MKISFTYDNNIQYKEHNVLNIYTCFDRLWCFQSFCNFMNYFTAKLFLMKLAENFKLPTIR